ncbi:hypothetical protein [Roseobacter sp. HKCCA0434]|uniref:hypothetical protein n=1 Tax=Roseobacter sp. HKCCA0434 TaxID=3079297 RepID=UPI0029057E9C|nr:hypothetical protein [Roseobacter sp. HKCCA0434]
MPKDFSRASSHEVTFEEAVTIVWPKLHDGELQSRIAAGLDCNGGRISEIKTGKRHPGSYQEAKRGGLI